MIITLCASLSAHQDILKATKDLEKLKFKVLYPWATEEIDQGKVDFSNLDSFKLINQSRAIKIHYNKIKKGDCILVINSITKHDIKNYIGGNTLMEMGFAFVLNKPIYLLNPIPKMIYTEELKAMKPIIIKGDLNKIRLDP